MFWALVALIGAAWLMDEKIKVRDKRIAELEARIKQIEDRNMDDGK